MPVLNLERGASGGWVAQPVERGVSSQRGGSVAGRDVRTVVEMKVTVASVIKADFYEGICRRHDARRVAVIKNWMPCAWTEGNPRGPAECRKAGVGSAIVVGHHNRCVERDEDEGSVHRWTIFKSLSVQRETSRQLLMCTGQLGCILRRVPTLAPCSSWTMFMAPSRCLAATPDVQTCHVTSSSGHRGLPSACGRARFSSSAGRAGGSVETEEDLYSILQVPRDADQREIKQAFYQSDHRCRPTDAGLPTLFTLYRKCGS